MKKMGLVLGILLLLLGIALVEGEQITTIEVDGGFLLYADKECHWGCQWWEVIDDDCVMPKKICYPIYDLSKTEVLLSKDVKTKTNAKGFEYTPGVICREVCECYWECCEWYPNGTDCRRSKKVCTTILSSTHFVRHEL